MSRYDLSVSLYQGIREKQDNKWIAGAVRRFFQRSTYVHNPSSTVFAARIKRKSVRMPILEGACSPPCSPWPPSIRRRYCRMRPSQARLWLSQYQGKHFRAYWNIDSRVEALSKRFQFVSTAWSSISKNKRVSRLSRNCGISIICSEFSEPSELEETHSFGRTHQPGFSSQSELLLWSHSMASEGIVFVLVCRGHCERETSNAAPTN